MIARKPAALWVLALAALGAAFALAGCGKQGELERPRPLVGHQVQPNAITRSRQAAEARARGDARAVADPQAPQSVDEAREEGAQLPPPPPLAGSTVKGAPAGPNAPPPPGGLPDPMHPATIPR